MSKDSDVTSDGGKLQAVLNEASASHYKVEGAPLAPITAPINAALANLNFGMPVQVESGDGQVTVSLAQQWRTVMAYRKSIQ